jgi:multiple sugar transport system ATP-binding protein
MNLAEAEVKEVDGRIVVVVQEGSEIAVDPAAVERYPRLREHIGKRVAVGIRPEHFAPVDEVAPDRVMRGLDVTLVEALGAETLVHVATRTTPIVSEDMRAAIDDEDAFEELKRQAAAGGQTFVLRYEPSRAPKFGDRVDVGVRSERIHFFDLENGRALR